MKAKLTEYNLGHLFAKFLTEDITLDVFFYFILFIYLFTF